MSSRLTAKQTHKKMLRARQVLITTHMSRASRWMNKSVLESAQIWVCDWVSVNIRSGDLVPTVDTSAPTVLPVHPFTSHIPITRGSRAEWRKLQYVSPSRHFGRFTLKPVGARHPHCTQQTHTSLLTRSLSFQQIKAAVCVMRDQIITST